MKLIESIVKQLLAVALVCTGSIVASAQPNSETQAREAAIRATIKGIEDECQRYAQGDWSRWYAQRADFRADLKGEIDAAKARMPLFKTDPTTRTPLLRADRHPPIFDWPDNAYYLVPDATGKWVSGRPSLGAMIRVSKWLRARGVDLIVVPVPRVAEIYGDTMVTRTPSDRILAPHMRRLVLELSQADVEVVDLLPALLKNRDTDPEALYLYADGHWSDRAQRLAAQELAKRLNRYTFVRKALMQKPLYRRVPTTLPILGSVYVHLNAQDKSLMKDILAATPITKVTSLVGEPFEEPTDSPVVVIGDSFTHVFQLAITKGSGIDALLSSEINIPISNVSSAGATTGPVKEFLRRPELISNRKVVIWIENNLALSYDSMWDLPEVIR